MQQFMDSAFGMQGMLACMGILITAHNDSLFSIQESVYILILSSRSWDYQQLIHPARAAKVCFIDIPHACQYICSISIMVDYWSRQSMAAQGLEKKLLILLAGHTNLYLLTSPIEEVTHNGGSTIHNRSQLTFTCMSS